MKITILRNKGNKFFFSAWHVFSVIILCIGLFNISDEQLSKVEYLLTTIIAVLTALISRAIFHHITAKTIRNSLLISGIVAFICCLWIENNTPIMLITPENNNFSIQAADNTEVKLTWAFWSKPEQGITDEIEGWLPVGDISNSEIHFSGDWTREGKNMICRGNCNLYLSDGFDMNQPIFTIESDTLAFVQYNDEELSLEPDVPLKLFASSHGVSRQIVFAILLICIWGVSSLPIAAAFKLIGNLGFTPPEISTRNILLYPTAFLLPIIICCSICYIVKIYPFGEKTFLITDMRAQYSDYLIYFRQILRGEKSLFYSFSKSIGDDFLSLYAYYLGNPVNWITTLVPISKFPQTLSLIILVRYGLCGLTSAIYFRNIFKTNKETLIFSSAYALIGFHFVISEHIQLRDGAIMLPIVLLGIDQLISKKGHSSLYIIALCSSILVNYYSAYQICFFCILYLIFKLLLERSFSWNIIKDFILDSLLSVGICAVFLIPVAVQLENGMKSFDQNLFSFELNMNIIELFSKLFNSSFDLSQTLTTGLPNIYCGLLITTAIPLFFFNNKITTREKILSGIMLLIFLAVMGIRTFNLILHGFNEPVWWPYRYSFIICLFMINITIRCYLNREGITFWGWLFSAGLILFMLITVYRQNYSWFSDDALYLNIFLTVLCFMLWFFTTHYNSKITSIFLIVLCLDLFLNGWMILEEKTIYNRSETITEFTSFFEENLPVIEKLKEFDSSFYRTEKTYNRNANDSMSLGYNGISHYSSTLNYSLMQFLPKIGYRYYPWRFLYGEGSTVATDSFLGIRYLLSDTEYIEKPYPPLFSESGRFVFKNDTALPIAFVGKDTKLNNDNAETFELLNQIFKSLTGGTEDIFTSADISSQNIEQLIPDSVQGCFQVIPSETEPELQYSFITDPQKSSYLYLMVRDGARYKTDLYVDNEYIAAYFDGQGVPILPLSNGQNSERELLLKPAETTFCLDEIQIYEEDYGILKQYAEHLKQTTVALYKNTETDISGEVISDGDGYLFFSIPYDKGWKIEIDGMKVAGEKAFGVFLSAPITSGNHTFHIHFQPEGLTLGCIISGISLIFLILLIISKKGISKHEQ